MLPVPSVTVAYLYVVSTTVFASEQVKPAPTVISYVLGYLNTTTPEPPLPPVAFDAPPPPPPVFAVPAPPTAAAPPLPPPCVA